MDIPPLKNKLIRKINTLRDTLEVLEILVRKQSTCWHLLPPVACTWFYTHLLRLGLSKTGATWVELMSKVIFLCILDSQAAFITARDKLQGPAFNLPVTPHKLFNIIIPSNCDTQHLRLQKSTKYIYAPYHMKVMRSAWRATLNALRETCSQQKQQLPLQDWIMVLKVLPLLRFTQE